MIKEIIDQIKTNKFIAVIVGLVLAMLILVFWPVNKTNLPVKEIAMLKNSKDYKMDVLDNKITSINWQNMEPKIPENTNIIDNQSSKIGESDLQKLAGWIGINNMTKIIDEKGLMMLKDKDKGSSIHINYGNNFVQFNRGYMGEDYFKMLITDQDIDLAKKSFEILSNQLLEWTSGNKAIATEIEYQAIIEPRTVTSTKSNANIVVIKANIEFDNKAIKTSFGAPLIVAKYGTGGLLVELKIENPKLNLAKGKEIKLLTWSQIKTISSKEIGVFSIQGNREFELSTQQDIINNLTVKSIKIEYYFAPINKTFMPMLVGEGTSELSGGPVNVTFGIPLAVN